MKTGILYFVLFLVTLQAIGQEINQEIKPIFIEIIKNNQPHGKVIYVRNISGNLSLSELVKEIFEKRKVIDRNTFKPIELTAQEINYLYEQLKDSIIWPENLFDNSISSGNDSLLNEQFNSEKEKRNLAWQQAILNKDSSILKDYTFLRQYTFYFGKPIFLRENTVCLISYGAICGGECGLSATYLYRKEKNVWKQWARVCGGVF